MMKKDLKIKKKIPSTMNTNHKEKHTLSQSKQRMMGNIFGDKVLKISKSG